MISSIKQTRQELLTWSLNSSLVGNKMSKAVLGNVAMSPHLKEQSTQKLKFSRSLLTLVLMGEFVSSTKHFWSFSVKQHSPSQLKYLVFKS